MPFIFFAWLLLSGFTPIFSNYYDAENIREEFSNLENDVQSQQFTVFQSTPVLSELKDGQIVIVSSGTYNKLMFRTGQDIFSISVSCVTVFR